MGVRVPGCLSVFPILFLSNSLCLYLLLLSFSLSYSFSLALSYFFFPILSLLFPFYFSVLPSSHFITPLYTCLTLSLSSFTYCTLSLLPISLPYAVFSPLFPSLCLLSHYLSTLFYVLLPSPCPPSPHFISLSSLSYTLSFYFYLLNSINLAYFLTSLSLPLLF